MKVFKTCMIIMMRRKWTILTYLLIFLPLAIVFSFSQAEQYNTDFEEAQPEYAIINRDAETPLTEGLRTFLADKGIEVQLEDNKEALQDASFFHEAEYIMIIPEGFSEMLFTDKEKALQTVTTPDSINGYYMDLLVNQYFDLARTYRLTTPDMDDAKIAEYVLNDLALSAQVEKVQYSNIEPISDGYHTYCRFMSYILMVLTILCTSTIIISFSRPEIRMKNNCSPVKPHHISIQMSLYSLITSIVIWFLLVVFGFAVHLQSLSGADIKSLLLIILNSFAYMLISMSVAMLAGSFANDLNSSNAFANIISLSFSFLGGVFVPLEMFGDSLLSLAKFVPTYWYSTALDNICSLTAFNKNTLAPIISAILIQLGFAFAIFCVSLVIRKKKSGSEKSYGSIQTYIEA